MMQFWQKSDTLIAAIIGGCFIVTAAIVSYTMLLMQEIRYG